MLKNPCRVFRVLDTVTWGQRVEDGSKDLVTGSVLKKPLPIFQMFGPRHLGPIIPDDTKGFLQILGPWGLPEGLLRASWGAPAFWGKGGRRGGGLPGDSGRPSATAGANASCLD